MMVVARGDPRVSLNLRVPPELKRQVEECAEQMGISINSAAIVLLAAGIRTERRRRRERPLPRASRTAQTTTNRDLNVTVEQTPIPHGITAAHPWGGTAAARKRRGP
jgi:antitoxin component of RelBE/YafQ-DinJ toxin-antitoxin module